ncbi:MAG TPA: HigA family addiction module antitoxin [Bryobacteraceae bacterium]|nr:HigA family addiction module antitoxin [Bryobacteraceae bacterium]
MKNPAHPGRIIKSACLEPLGLSLTSGAKALGISRQALARVVNQKSGVSAEMALRLAKAFGSTPETWLRMQMAWDLALARQNEGRIRVQRQRIRQELRVD